MRILVVDDEPDLCEILCFNLESEGFEAERAYSAEAALALMEQGPQFDLILLDVMMEQMSGYDMARQLRERGNNTPIIFLTAMGTEDDLLRGFAVGADDYITKPFSFPTVLARIRAVLKRSSSDGVQPTTSLVRQGAMEIDLLHKAVTIEGMPVALTRKEYHILALLAQHPGEHFSREQIIDNVWDDDAYVGDRSVDVHIARLRKKLGSYSDSIVNHSGFGYTFVPSN
jgi:DNA-binding response OmpR family regulator